MQKLSFIATHDRVLKFLWFVIAIVLLNSCQTEEEISPVTTARQWFEKYLGTEWDAWPSVSKVKSIEWGSAVSLGNSIEVPVLLEEELTAHIFNGEKNSKGKLSVRLVIWPEKDTYRAIIVEFIHLGGNLPSNLTEIESSGFSGMVKVSEGAEKKSAAFFENGIQYGKNENVVGREELTVCLWFLYEHSISDGTNTVTWIEWELQYCYDDTQPQAPLPPEGGGWVLDYTGNGSGSGSQYSAGFPSSPQNGDLFEDRQPKQTITYRYNSTTGWKAFRVQFSTSEVTASTHSFLYNIPHSLVLGTDGFLYQLDDANMIWIGTRCIQNQLTNPCLNTTTDQVLDPNVASTFNNLIQDIFNSSDKVNLILKDNMTLPSTVLGKTMPLEQNGEIINITIYLNASELASRSQEFITATIYHEAFHAIVKYLDRDDFFKNSATEHHVAIFSTYLDLLATGIQVAFPNISLRNAQGLILKGMLNYSSEWGTLYDKILENKGFEEIELVNTALNYSYGYSGTYCP